jgi:D-alanyl-D-alanine dipeptidase
MESAGFRPYGREWWHYTLADEPHPDTYFDFVITAADGHQEDARALVGV